MKGKYLVNTDAFFTAPDGKEYKAVWGKVEILDDSFLGIKTNSRSANWFAKIGSEDNHVIVAGCQIHYAVKSDKKPFTEWSYNWGIDDARGIEWESQNPTKIYIAE